MLLDSTIRLLALVLGAGLNVFLAVLFAGKKFANLSDRVAVAALVALAVWQVSSAVQVLQPAVVGEAGTRLIALADHVQIAAAALLPVLVLHLAVLWSGVRVFGTGGLYLLIPFAWWMLERSRFEILKPGLALLLMVASVLCGWAWWHGNETLSMRRFLAIFALALFAVTIAVATGGQDSATMAAILLAPPLVLARWIYRFNLFGLLIRPRFIFALKMGFTFAFYLLIVHAVARILQEEFEAFSALVELVLVFAAAIVWLPLYVWMNSFLSRRTTVYNAFSKCLTEEGARIVDFPKRVQFLASEMGRALALNRVLLVTGGDAPLLGWHGPRDADEVNLPAWREKLLRLARANRTDFVNVSGTANPAVRELLSGAGFNYFVPLWYEDRLNGLLLLDTSPRLFLEDDESVLPGLSGQISHSLETGRVIEEKISLERRLAHEQHLATLGRAAATLAHEVKNPLSSIKTLAQLMMEDAEVEARHSRDLGFILGEVDRLNRTVQQLLSFSRPVFLREDEVNLSELLELTADVLAREHSADEIRIVHSIQPCLMLRKASSEALEQVILNVILNAIQASHTGSTVKLEARATPAENIAISVTDEGPGIAPEIRRKIFEPFFTTRHKGTGLGLAIVRKNLEQMGGVIDVVSPVANNRGARVSITLPCE